VGASPLKPLDAGSVIAALEAGACANRSAKCRQGSIDVIDAPAHLIATGDLHDNPVHLERLIRVARLDSGTDPAHLTLQEIIHGDRLVSGMDLSYRMLAHVALLKAAYPEQVHILLGNHELAQMQKAGIVKEGIRSVEAFEAGLEYVFGDRAPEVSAAIDGFIRSMPLALRARTPQGDILCAHSLPPAAAMGRFDTSVLFRDLADDDYAPRQGAAHLMVWGRGYDVEGLEDLVERWGVYLFILGHEKAPEGVLFVPPNAVVLNSDHERGVYLPIDLSNPPRPEEAAQCVRPLRSS
jgi:hypothetical protein